jgi:SRSO17 transposase
MAQQLLHDSGAASYCFESLLRHPLEIEPYTPAHHFEGKNDPGFGAKPHIAMELVERALEMGLPFRAVVGDILYGEHRKFKEGL